MTAYYNFYGKAMWAKVHTPDPEYQTYTVDAYLDDKSFNLLKTTGIELKIREGQLGNETRKFVKFRRPVSKVIKNQLVEFGPVPVEDEKGQKITDLVGNGSDCVFFVSIYDTRKGSGHRLDKLIVKNLVEYKGITVQDAHALPDDAGDESRRLDSEPVKAETKKSAGKATATFDDEIPF